MTLEKQNMGTGKLCTMINIKVPLWRWYMAPHILVVLNEVAEDFEEGRIPGPLIFL